MFKELIAEYAEESGKPLEMIAAALAQIGQQGRPFLLKDQPNRKQRDRSETGETRTGRDRGERNRRERFDRNFAWFQLHSAEIHANYRGKCICIAGEELFVADASEQALALGTAAHPDDDGSFVHYIALEKLTRIYAD